jgi:hypothetical protein
MVVEGQMFTFSYGISVMDTPVLAPSIAFQAYTNSPYVANTYSGHEGEREKIGGKDEGLGFVKGVMRIQR